MRHTRGNARTGRLGNDARTALVCSMVVLILLLHGPVAGVTPTVASDHHAPEPVVVLLHGLGRTSRSMVDLAEALSSRGRRVVNLDYPSSQYPIAELTERIARMLDACCPQASQRGLDFVTHSLGGIVVRELHRQRPDLAIRRVVMLGPPNRGSELVDALGRSALFKLVTGPAGQELGTGPDSVPNRQGPVRFQLGVVAGTRSLNPIYSRIIPGEDDGTVAVSRTKVAGMADFVTVPANHTLIMHHDEAIRRAVEFVEQGRFAR